MVWTHSYCSLICLMCRLINTYASLLETCFGIGLIRLSYKFGTYISSPNTIDLEFHSSSCGLTTFLSWARGQFIMDIWFIIFNHPLFNIWQQYQFKLPAIAYHSNTIFNQLTTTRSTNRSQNKELLWAFHQQYIPLKIHALLLCIFFRPCLIFDTRNEYPNQLLAIVTLSLWIKYYLDHSGTFYKLGAFTQYRVVLTQVIKLEDMDQVRKWKWTHHRPVTYEYITVKVSICAFGDQLQTWFSELIFKNG